MSKMIPLHFADQAVAACEKEIAGLRGELTACKAESDRLKAEVERLKAEVEILTLNPSHYLDDDGEWVSNTVFYRMQERLKAEVERLRKAGDVICLHYFALGRERWPNDPLPSCVTDWIAAREGKP